MTAVIHSSYFLHFLCGRFLIAVFLGHTSVAASAANEASDAAVPARRYAAIPARRYVGVARLHHLGWLHNESAQIVTGATVRGTPGRRSAVLLRTLTMGKEQPVTNVHLDTDGEILRCSVICR